MKICAGDPERHSIERTLLIATLGLAMGGCGLLQCKNQDYRTPIKVHNDPTGKSVGSIALKLDPTDKSHLLIYLVDTEGNPVKSPCYIPGQEPIKGLVRCEGFDDNGAAIVQSIQSVGILKYGQASCAMIERVINGHVKKETVFW